MSASTTQATVPVIGRILLGIIFILVMIFRPSGIRD